MANRYLFQTHSINPCDICDGMEGEYDYRPFVPVHPQCKCRVSEVTSEPQFPVDADSCDLEVRNLVVWEETYVGNHTIDAPPNPADSAGTIDVEVILEIQRSSFDDGVQEALAWEPTYGNDSAPVVIPAHTTGGKIVLEVEFTQMVCSGELWQVCTMEEHEAGVYTISETLVGPVGGMVIALTSVLSASFDGDDRPYFDDDDEVPT